NPSLKFNYIDSRTNGEQIIGYGKSVEWLDESTAVILANSYSLDYTEWKSSTIEMWWFTNDSDFKTIFSIFPNKYQSLYQPPISSIFINVLTTLESVIFHDVNEDLCIAGTYKKSCTIGRFLFSTCENLCSMGMNNPGYSINTSTECITCKNSTSFCPLGAVSEVNPTKMSIISQAVSYSHAPDNTVFDDILMQNTFNINFKLEYIVVSPFSWATLMLIFAMIILIMIGLLKFSVKCEKFRHFIKQIFEQTDLIGEGELWLGGLMSIAVFVLIVFAYMFSNAYVKQYPFENAGNSTFSCDKSLHNAQFSTSMQSLALPPSSKLELLFRLSNNQLLTLHVSFVNSIFNCTELSVYETIEIFGLVFLISELIFLPIFEIMCKRITKLINNKVGSDKNEMPQLKWYEKKHNNNSPLPFVDRRRRSFELEDRELYQWYYK
ncbi:unnamed protein product, partial [Didymodactylos carnosus]